MTTLAAVDLGASSGRVMLGKVTGQRLVLEEIHRFPNAAIAVPTPAGMRLHWDVLALWSNLRQGLAAVGRGGPVASVGIDTWAVDYGLLDADGALLGYPAAYRCERSAGAAERFFGRLPQPQLYAEVGLQTLPFNTVFQLLAETRLEQASTLLLLPDLLSYWLTGECVAEVTNASTTGLLNPRTRQWSPAVLGVLGQYFNRDLADRLPRLVEPGQHIGTVSAEGLELVTSSGAATAVIAVGSHDTASAVVGVPAQEEDFAYISCGTWSLIGLELPAPILTEEAAAANITNELGVDGTTRFLSNVMGLWVLNETVRGWREAGDQITLPNLLAAAGRLNGMATVIDIDDAILLTPGDMPERIATLARRTGQRVPTSHAEITRCILDSLALAYRRKLRQILSVSQRQVSVIHLVGGGVHNRLLCQLTADATGLPVVAGPVEATALGNMAVQARAVGAIDGGLDELRRLVRESSTLTRYLPRSDSSCWEEAEQRLGA